MVFIIDSQSAGGKGAENTKFLSSKMTRTSMKILFSVSFFTKKLVRNETIIHSGEENIKERKATIHLYFQRELDGLRLGVKVV